MESEGGEDGLYSTILGEMGGEGGAPAVMNDADGIGSTAAADDETILKFKGGAGPGEGGEPDVEEFMTRALQEAVSEARSQTPQEVAEAAQTDSILDDEEMMREINELFDSANQKLVDSIKEIQREQSSLAEASAKERQEAVLNNEARLAEAEAGVARLMETVSKETLEVEKALADLQAAKTELDADPLSKMSDLKGGGIAKQGAFVGMALFTLRALIDAAAMAGPDGEAHAAAAAIQGVIAVACAAYFFLA
uniref:Uncharacterized protein n=2 Tax=Trieres chinensis TaxID=1514140 RepID=A0A7S1ZUT5_TRICV